MSSTDPKLVRDWLKALGTLTAGSMPHAEANARVDAYVPLLVCDFPPGAFTGDSLKAVARECKFFPAYAEVIQHLGAWWKSARPLLPELPPPGPVAAVIRCTPEQARESIARNWPGGVSPSGAIERAVWKMLHNIAGETVQ